MENADSFLVYLENLPAASLNRLWGDIEACIAVYQQLDGVACYTIQRLLLVAGATPFEELRSWHPLGFKSRQNPVLLRLKHLQILQGRSGEVWLNEQFRANLVKAFSGNLTDVAGTGGEGASHAIDSPDDGESRWESLLYLLVTGARQSSQQGHLFEVLTGAGLVSPTDQSITSKGFQFLLSSRRTQLWIVLIQYFLMIEASGDDVVTFISAVCSLVLQPYSANVTGILAQLSAATFLGDIGLVRMVKSRGRWEYFATALVRKLVVSEQQSIANSGFIVVETNYKVYAYTSSPLQIAILGIFVRLRDRFANMVHGQLTGPSVQAALSKGITAAQIIDYLQQHLHCTMQKAGFSLSPVIVDQIHLWERDRNRLKHVEGYLYQQFLTDSDFKRTVEEAQRLAVVQYVNFYRKILVVREDAHPAIKAFIKTELQQ